MKKLLISMLLLSSGALVQAEQDTQEQPRKHARRYALAPDPKDNYHYNAYKDVSEESVTQAAPSKKRAPTEVQKNSVPSGTLKRFSLFG